MSRCRPYGADWSERLIVARQIADEGGCLRHVADAWGVSAARITMVLPEKDADLHRQLRDNSRRTRSLSADEVSKRLSAYAESGNMSATARQFGMTPSGFFLFLKRYAPFGVEDALEDYLEDAA